MGQLFLDNKHVVSCC